MSECDEKYKKIFECSRDAIVLFDPEKGYVDCNPAALKMFDIDSKDKFCSLDPSALSPEYQPDQLLSADRLKMEISRAVEYGENLFEWRYRTLSGREFPATVLITSIELDGTTILQSSIRDITLRKQAVEELQESQIYNRTLFEASSIGLALCRMDGTFIDVNQACADIIGYTIEEALKLTYWEVTPKKYESQEAVQLESLQITGGYGPYEKEYLHKDGTLIPVRLRGALIKIRGEEYIWSSIEDITERKQAENALKESEERFRALHNASFGGIAIHDMGTILECNQGLSEITGYSTSELIGMDGLKLISDDTRHIVIGNIKSGFEKSYEAVGVRKKGERYPLRLEAKKIPYKGKEVRVVEFRDITERVELEKLMVQSEKMSSVAGLAAGLAHEINNPLAAIMQGYQNTLNRINPDKPKNQKAAERFNLNLTDMYNYLLDRNIITFIEGGRAAGERAAQIVRNMLLFSRNSDSKSAMINIAELVDYTIELGSADYDMKNRYDFKFIDIVKEYDENMPGVVCCPSEIEQVLLNLFKNAVQAMEEMNVDDHKPQFYVRLIKEADFIRMEIEDNGPGMTEYVKTRLFEPFFTTKPVGSGTGLGLSVSYMIITQNHGGTLEVESEIGKGTKFIIRLPLGK